MMGDEELLEARRATKSDAEFCQYGKVRRALRGESDMRQKRKVSAGNLEETQKKRGDSKEF